MKTVIYYFSGTGNSLAVAKGLAQKFEDGTDIRSIACYQNEQFVEVDADLLGLVFPVYFLAIPDIVREFLKKLQFKTNPYLFTVVTCNAQPGHSLDSVNRMLSHTGKSLAFGFAMDMPGNALVGKVDMTNPPQVQKDRLSRVEEKLSMIAQQIKERRYGVIAGCNTKKNYFESFLMNAFIKYVYRPAKRFRVQNHCTHCNTCALVCPLQNIRMDHEKRPIWGDHCALCLACFHWCPRQAIDLDQHTIGKVRYHHPEITIEEMVRPGYRKD